MLNYNPEQMTQVQILLQETCKGVCEECKFSQLCIWSNKQLNKQEENNERTQTNTYTR